MDIYTLNVGQGQFVVVTGGREAIIVDTYVPLNTENEIVHVKSALRDILQDKELIGLMITGFDSDHFNEVGLRIVLHKYRPNWIMYPKYFKTTKVANTCFNIIGEFENEKSFKRISVSLDKIDSRFYTKLSEEFQFEVFSPHVDDMNSSNNCSLVCKILERSTGSTYLVTGDTEIDRWDSIVDYFSRSLSSDVMAAPHHGSKNGISEQAIDLIDPIHVLVSAGVDNQFGHPNSEAMELFDEYADAWFATNAGDGQSLLTRVTRTSVNTYKYEP